MRAQLLILLLPLAAVAGCDCGSTPPTMETLRPEGELCERDGECVTGLCQGIREEPATCLRKCTEGCTAEELCSQLAPERFGCVREHEGLCGACTSDSECPYPADRCIALGGERFCGRDCSYDGECPETFRCVDSLLPDGTPAGRQCVPVSGTCQCTSAAIDLVVPCESQNSFGACMGTQTCRAQGWSRCTALVPAAEVCNGIDDDCNQEIDEAFGPQMCGTGACTRTVESCVDGGVVQCVPGEPVNETCNGIDDDCDGAVDEDFDLDNDVNRCGACDNVCSAPNATPECSAGACGIASCNAGYVDCDGLLANGCEVTPATDVQHCGACNSVCSFANAVPACVGGGCELLECQPNYWNLDGDDANGCEYACTYVSPIDLPDLGFSDANCDGIDGEVDNAVFVAPPVSGGNDLNAGTRDAPLATLAAALTQAEALSKRDVYVASGTYAEQLSIASPRGVYGGYAAMNWGRSLSYVTSVIDVNQPLRISYANGTVVQLMDFVGASATGTGSLASAYGALIRFSTDVVLERVSVKAGNGLNGAAGTAGAAGLNGNPGVNGEAGREDSDAFGCQVTSQPSPGAGGASTCSRAGGRGGYPGRVTDTGEPGLEGSLGTPGGAGVPYDYCQNDACTGGFNLPSQYHGSDGTHGGTGSHGTSGAGFGGMNSLGYTVASTSSGTSGAAGNGGGGGGGGGGGDYLCDSWGSGGGGGGSGGCGGVRGLRGISGGASFALYAYSSTVTAIDSVFRAGNGGKGGNGGSGGSGGTGAAGGISPYGNNDSQNDASPGGKGGRGGNGGTGGAGGAGGGGPSVAIVTAGTTPSFTAVGTTSLAIGSGGAGGSSVAGAGAAGVAQTNWP